MKMNFIAQAVGGSAPFATLRRNLKKGRSLCVSGLSAVCKADVILNGGQALCIAADEKEAQTLCNDLSCMGLRAFVYPVRDYNFLDLQSRSHEYEHLRLKVLLKLIEEECDVVIACLDAASQLTVPQDFLADIVLSVWEGKTLDLDRAVRALTLLGYERFDATIPSARNSGATKSPT